jgi:hypothetical protein
MEKLHRERQESALQKIVQEKERIQHELQVAKKELRKKLKREMTLLQAGGGHTSANHFTSIANSSLSKIMDLEQLQSGLQDVVDYNKESKHNGSSNRNTMQGYMQASELEELGRAIGGSPQSSLRQRQKRGSVVFTKVNVRADGQLVGANDSPLSNSRTVDRLSKRRGSMTNSDMFKVLASSEVNQRMSKHRNSNPARVTFSPQAGRQLKRLPVVRPGAQTAVPSRVSSPRPTPMTTPMMNMGRRASMRRSSLGLVSRRSSLIIPENGELLPDIGHLDTPILSPMYISADDQRAKEAELSTNVHQLSSYHAAELAVSLAKVQARATEAQYTAAKVEQATIDLSRREMWTNQVTLEREKRIAKYAKYKKNNRAAGSAYHKIHGSRADPYFYG